MPIPRLLHQTCPDPAALPPELHDNLLRLRALNPRWEHRVFGDADVLEYAGRHYGPAVLEALHRIAPGYGVVRADLFRYLVVYREGGVYLDIKSGLRRPLDEVLRPDDAFLLSQWRNRLGEPHAGWGLHPELARIPGGEFQQWHVAAAPGHPFLAQVIRRVVANILRYDPQRDGVGKPGVLRLSGPVCYTKAIFPMLGRHRHRIVDAHALGFDYSIYPRAPGGPWHARAAAHYSRLTAPIVLPPGR